MSEEITRRHLSAPFTVVRESFTNGADLMLACCGGASHPTHPEPADWVSAAEIVYELTKVAGTVAGSDIRFDTPEGATIHIGVQDGRFVIVRENLDPQTGRKGLDLLMQWKGFSFDQAIKFLFDTYSPEVAQALAEDYVQMKIAALKEDASRNT